MTNISDRSTDDKDPLHEHTALENFQDTLHGVDEPMEEAHPTSASLMVFGVYPLMLIVFLLVAIAVVSAIVRS